VGPAITEWIVHLAKAAAESLTFWLHVALTLATKAITWLTRHWPEVVTAVATAATALVVWRDRIDKKRAEQPFVECAFTPSETVGWHRVSLLAGRPHR
jgi:hypothetical protein